MNNNIITNMNNYTIDYIKHNNRRICEYNIKNNHLSKNQYIYNINYNLNSNIKCIIEILKNIMYNPDIIERYKQVSNIINTYFENAINYIYENRKILCTNPKSFLLSKFTIFNFMKTKNDKNYIAFKYDLKTIIYTNQYKYTELEMKKYITTFIGIILFNYFIEL